MTDRVLITGSSGFIGTNLVRYLQSHDYQVLGLDAAPPRDPSLVSSHRTIDILEPDNLTRAVSDFQPSAIVHLAARTDFDGRRVEDYRANTVGCLNILSATRQTPSVQRLLVASSRLVCRIGRQPRSDTEYCPPNAYGESKVITELLVRAADLDCVTTLVRPTSIWGPWFGVPYRGFFDAVLAGRYVHPRGERVQKSFGYVGNTVWQLGRLLDAAPSLIDKKTFYLADYTPLEVLDFASSIREAAGLGPVREVPLAALKLAARVGDAAEKVGSGKAPLTSFRLENLRTSMLFDMESLARVTGPAPFSVREGIRPTLDWLSEEVETAVPAPRSPEAISERPYSTAPRSIRK